LNVSIKIVKFPA